jgi:hypothetical protein
MTLTSDEHVSLEAVITKADGTVVKLGVIASGDQIQRVPPSRRQWIVTLIRRVLNH